MIKYKMVEGKECPHCGTMIDHLNEYREVLQKYTVIPYTDNGLQTKKWYCENDYEFIEEVDVLRSDYECPECGERLDGLFFAEEIEEKENKVNPISLIIK